MIKIKKTLLLLCSLASISGLQAAVQVQIQIDNLSSPGGLYFTPVWLGAHDGSFDYYDVGSSASASLKSLAEGGDTSGLNTDFGTSNGRISTTLVAPSGIGPGLYNPAASSSTTLMLDGTQNRYLSYASMILPSNDAFWGNDNAMAIELFDGSGNFNGTQTFMIYGSDLMDAGTELNDTLGAPFSAIGGTSSIENQLIGMHSGLDNFIGSGLGDGTTLGSAFTPITPIASISVSAVPEPETYAAIFGIFALGFAIYKKRTSK